MRIFATLPSGKKVPHGQIIYGTGIFTRTIPSHYIRFSDRSFCLNTTVIDKLRDKHCTTLQFIHVTKKGKTIYRLPFEEAMTKGTVKINEYGEENLRIPIVECRVHKTIIDGAPGKLPDVKEPEPEDPQQSLFNENE